MPECRGFHAIAEILNYNGTSNVSSTGRAQPSRGEDSRRSSLRRNIASQIPHELTKERRNSINVFLFSFFIHFHFLFIFIDYHIYLLPLTNISITWCGYGASGQKQKEKWLPTIWQHGWKDLGFATQCRKRSKSKRRHIDMKHIVSAQYISCYANNDLNFVPWFRHWLTLGHCSFESDIDFDILPRVSTFILSSSNCKDFENSTF